MPESTYQTSPLKHALTFLLVTLFATAAILGLVSKPTTALTSGANTTAANVFVSSIGDDGGSNCKRFSTPQSTPPSAASVCKDWAAAYTVAQLGDTVWVLPGNYTEATDNPQDFSSDSSNHAVNGKSLASNNCDDAKQCVYFMPQPGQESAVKVGGTYGLDISDDVNHSYFLNFKSGACPSIGAGGDDVTDITFDNIKGVVGGTISNGCKPNIGGHQQYVRILNSEFSYNCNAGTASGWAIQADTPDGESSDPSNTPTNILIKGNYIHDFTINQGGGSCGPQSNPHQDCLHIYAMLNSTISGNKFDRCYDSSILAEGFDRVGYPENNIIENNWFGPTILGANNCCFRGDNQNPANETFDNWTIRFNTSTSTFNNKTDNVLNNVSFIGNVGLEAPVCSSGNNVVWAYNLYGGTGGTCGGSDKNGATVSNLKLTNISNGSLDLHLQAGSWARDYVPVSVTNGCGPGANSTDIDGDSRPQGSACDAGADEMAQGGTSVKSADINHDGSVNIIDASMMFTRWNSADSSCDLNGDTIVNQSDVDILVKKWGTSG